MLVTAAEDLACGVIASSSTDTRVKDPPFQLNAEQASLPTAYGVSALTRSTLIPALQWEGEELYHFRHKVQPQEASEGGV